MIVAKEIRKILSIGEGTMLPVVIIPAYQPETKLVDIVTKLSENKQRNIIVVNDGSASKHNVIFQTIKQLPNVVVLKHAENLGKGQALKTGFNHYLVNFAHDHIGIVTADADGQHVQEDILKVERELLSHPRQLIIGARKFRGKIPFRSRFGNIVTRLFFRFIAGLKLSDTQSGLRAIPRFLVEEMLEVTTSGYDFELDMLMRAARRRIRIKEVRINTIYIGKNNTSHFNPLVDSLKIYFVFIRFTAVSILSAILDFVLFTGCFYVVRDVFTSIVFARVLSCTFNFIFGKRVTFRSRGSMLPESIKFIILAVLLMLISYGLITSMVNFLHMDVYISKIVSECTLFFMSFAAQRVFVFRSALEPTDVSLE